MEPNVILFLLVIGTLLLVPVIVMVGWALRARPEQGPRPRRRLVHGALVSVGLLVLGVALVRGVLPSQEAVADAIGLPASLGGLELEQRATGADAMGQLTELHGQELEVVSTETASYAGPEGTAQVWVGWAATEDDAHTMAAEMTRAMRERETPFTVPERQLDGTWGAEGLGQLHRYFASGTGVWWIAADTDVLGRTLAELLTLAGSPH